MRMTNAQVGLMVSNSVDYAKSTDVSFIDKSTSDTPNDTRKEVAGVVYEIYKQRGYTHDAAAAKVEETANDGRTIDDIINRAQATKVNNKIKKPFEIDAYDRQLEHYTSGERNGYGYNYTKRLRNNLEDKFNFDNNNALGTAAAFVLGKKYDDKNLRYKNKGTNPDAEMLAHAGDVYAAFTAMYDNDYKRVQDLIGAGNFNHLKAIDNHISELTAATLHEQGIPTEYVNGKLHVVGDGGELTLVDSSVLNSILTQAGLIVGGTTAAVVAARTLAQFTPVGRIGSWMTTIGAGVAGAGGAAAGGVFDALVAAYEQQEDLEGAAIYNKAVNSGKAELLAGVLGYSAVKVAQFGSNYTKAVGRFFKSIKRGNRANAEELVLKLINPKLIENVEDKAEIKAIVDGVMENARNKWKHVKLETYIDPDGEVLTRPVGEPVDLMQDRTLEGMLPEDHSKLTIPEKHELNMRLAVLNVSPLAHTVDGLPVTKAEIYTGVRRRHEQAMQAINNITDQLSPLGSITDAFVETFVMTKNYVQEQYGKFMLDGTTKFDSAGIRMNGAEIINYIDNAKFGGTTESIDLKANIKTAIHNWDGSFKGAMVLRRDLTAMRSGPYNKPSIDAIKAAIDMIDSKVIAAADNTAIHVSSAWEAQYHRAHELYSAFKVSESDLIGTALSKYNPEHIKTAEQLEKLMYDIYTSDTASKSTSITSLSGLQRLRAEGIFLRAAFKKHTFVDEDGIKPSAVYWANFADAIDKSGIDSPNVKRVAEYARAFSHIFGADPAMAKHVAPGIKQSSAGISFVTNLFRRAVIMASNSGVKFTRSIAWGKNVDAWRLSAALLGVIRNIPTAKDFEVLVGLVPEGDREEFTRQLIEFGKNNYNDTSLRPVYGIGVDNADNPLDSAFKTYSENARSQFNQLETAEDQQAYLNSLDINALIDIQNNLKTTDLKTKNFKNHVHKTIIATNKNNRERSIEEATYMLNSGNFKELEEHLKKLIVTSEDIAQLQTARAAMARDLKEIQSELRRGSHISTTTSRLNTAQKRVDNSKNDLTMSKDEVDKLYDELESATKEVESFRATGATSNRTQQLEELKRISNELRMLDINITAKKSRRKVEASKIYTDNPKWDYTKKNHNGGPPTSGGPQTGGGPDYYEPTEADLLNQTGLVDEVVPPVAPKVIGGPPPTVTNAPPTVPPAVTNAPPTVPPTDKPIAPKTLSTPESTNTTVKNNVKKPKQTTEAKERVDFNKQAGAISLDFMDIVGIHPATIIKSGASADYTTGIVEALKQKFKGVKGARSSHLIALFSELNNVTKFIVAKNIPNTNSVNIDGVDRHLSKVYDLEDINESALQEGVQLTEKAIDLVYISKIADEAPDYRYEIARTLKLYNVDLRKDNYEKIYASDIPAEKMNEMLNISADIKMIAKTAQLRMKMYATENQRIIKEAMSYRNAGAAIQGKTGEGYYVSTTAMKADSAYSALTVKLANADEIQKLFPGKSLGHAIVTTYVKNKGYGGYYNNDGAMYFDKPLAGWTKGDSIK